MAAMFSSNKAFDKILVPAQTVDGVSLSKRLIEKEIRRVARQIEAFYGPYDGNDMKVPLVVGVLFGALHVHPMLMEAFSVGFPHFPGIIRAKSYKRNGVRTPVEISNPVMEAEIKGRRVLIVDDVIESGQTLYMLKHWFYERGAADVRVFTLLNKPDKLEFDVKVNWSVFSLKPGQWVVGKGLDDNGLFRHFPNVVILEDPESRKGKASA
jgi:hypoxanthine phosphoribosyltransferase